MKLYGWLLLLLVILGWATITIGQSSTREKSEVGQSQENSTLPQTILDCLIFLTQKQAEFGVKYLIPTLSVSLQYGCLRRLTVSIRKRN